MDNSENRANSFPEEGNKYYNQKFNIQMDQIYDLYTQMDDCGFKKHLEAWFKSYSPPAHYAPVRPGKISGTIVTDVSTHRDEEPVEMDKEIGYYGGFLVAESVPTVRLRDQLIEAYNQFWKA